MAATRMITLTIKKPGSLFPVLLEREITDAQHSMIALLLEQPELTYGEVVDFVRDHRHLVALANDQQYLDWLTSQRPL